ncbi:MAG TPA: hypothetical protein VJG30_03085 [Candidatus Nanoarchaeia archaeon]|nr:hypothetical protein [Candidatus Nanoarchaeia archaeon]
MILPRIFARFSEKSGIFTRSQEKTVNYINSLILLIMSVKWQVIVFISIERSSLPSYKNIKLLVSNFFNYTPEESYINKSEEVT